MQEARHQAKQQQLLMQEQAHKKWQQQQEHQPWQQQQQQQQPPASSVQQQQPQQPQVEEQQPQVEEQQPQQQQPQAVRTQQDLHRCRTAAEQLLQQQPEPASSDQQQPGPASSDQQQQPAPAPTIDVTEVMIGQISISSVSTIVPGAPATFNIWDIPMQRQMALAAQGSALPNVPVGTEPIAAIPWMGFLWDLESSRGQQYVMFMSNDAQEWCFVVL